MKRIDYWKCHATLSDTVRPFLNRTYDYQNTPAYLMPDSRYVGFVDLAWPLHKRINERARALEWSGPDGHCTTDRHATLPTFNPTPERTARSRYRNARRRRQRGEVVHDCTDIFFGLRPTGSAFDYNNSERRKLQLRMLTAAQHRGPLHPFSLLQAEASTLTHQAA